MGTSFVERLAGATNAHDVEAIAECFTDDYVNVTPCHPAMGFTGRDQVRRNWTAILAAVPDLRATVRETHEHDDTVWSEWEMSGTRRDAAPHLLRGVIVFTVADGRATRARFYLEPVVDMAATPDEAVARSVGVRP